MFSSKTIWKSDWYLQTNESKNSSSSNIIYASTVISVGKYYQRQPSPSPCSKDNIGADLPRPELFSLVESQIVDSVWSLLLERVVCLDQQNTSKRPKTSLVKHSVHFLLPRVDFEKLCGIFISPYRHTENGLRPLSTLMKVQALCCNTHLPSYHRRTFQKHGTIPHQLQSALKPTSGKVWILV